MVVLPVSLAIMKNDLTSTNRHWYSGEIISILFMYGESYTVLKSSGRRSVQKGEANKSGVMSYFVCYVLGFCLNLKPNIYLFIPSAWCNAGKHWAFNEWMNESLKFICFKV